MKRTDLAALERANSLTTRPRSIRDTSRVEVSKKEPVSRGFPFISRV